MEFHSCDLWNIRLLLCLCVLMGDNLASAEIGECSSFDGSEKGIRFLRPPLNCTGCPAAIEQIDLKENMFKINDSFIVFHGVRRITLSSSPHLQVRNYSSNYWLVTVKKEFDREDPEFDYQDFYTESISCTPLNDDSAIPYDIRLHILNVIEEGPKFPKSRYDMNVSEDTTKGTSLMTILPVFAETNDVLLDFSLTSIGGNYNLVLDVSSVPSRSADITLLKELDYDKGVTLYNMILTAKVNGMSNLTATTEIVVHVTDVDDQNPTFTQEIYSCSVPEEVVIHTSVMCDTAPNAYDQDKGLNEKVNYRIVGIADHISMPFVIDAVTGKITVNGTIDREKKDSYAFTIMANQRDKPSLRRATSLVYIHITDVNDNAPVMSSTTYNVSIPENLPEGTFVLKVEATDLDKGNNSLFAFQLSGTYVPFEIDQRSGVITVRNSTLLDRETVSIFKFEVQAFETATKEHQTSHKSSVTVTLQDQNDNSPEFNVSNKQVIYVNKTTPVDTIIGQVGAFDRDTGDFGKVMFSLSGSNDTIQKFKIDRHTGNIKVAESLMNNHFINFSKSATDIAQELENTFIRNYGFDVIASDSDRKERRQAATAMVINVLDENVNPPFVVWPPTKPTIKISENFPTKVMFLKVDALDLDPDDIPSLTLTVDPQPFAISKNIIYLSKHLDRENQLRYDLHVRVSDSKHKNITTYKIEVTDENDNAPRFSREMYNFSITEEMENEMVGVVNATDRDDGDNAKFDYGIVPSLWSNNFSISANGTIVTKTKIDRELLENSVISLNILAVDHGSPKLTGASVVNINVTDVNDNPPAFFDDAETLFVVDELAVKSNFCQVKASDPDQDEILFNLTKNPYNTFHIDPSGFVSVVSPINLDVTKSSTLTFTVEASNKKPYANTKLNNPKRNITVLVKDVNNHGPLFSKSSYEFDVIEGITGNLSEKCIKATDDDIDISNTIIRYRIISGDVDDHLYIDSHTGCIQIVTSFDYENVTTYSVEVEATDRKPWYQNKTSAHNVSATVRIHVKDINDNAPYFDQDIYLCNINETYSGTIPNCSISARDDDASSAYKTLTYTMQHVEPKDNLFHINESTGLIGIRSHLDYEDTRGYILTVEVSDKKFKSQCRVILVVLDENDNEPEFRNLPPGGVISVLEDTPVGDVILTVEAHDNDINDVLTYSIVPKDTFAVNKSSGNIQLVKSLNASSVNNYNLTVTVSDGLHDTSTILIIDVKDVNNNPPIFEKMNYNFTVAEGRIFKTHVKASDADINDNIIYSLIQGPWQNNFTINTKTGNITSNSKLDREAVGSEDDVIILDVIATDSTHPYRTGLTTVSIKVTDVNDNLPYFTRKYVHIEIEELTVNKTVLTLEAFDDDIGKNNEILFKQSSSIVTGITITEDGKLQIDKPMHIYNQSTQTISIDVVAFNPTPYNGDHRNRNKTQTIQITIKDVNDHGPVFSKPTYNFVVAEGTVGTLSSECIKAMDNDVDVSNMMITYRLVSGNEDGHLYIDSHTGCLQIVRPYDYENSTKYSVVIGANDAKPWYKNDTKIHNVTTRVNIRIQDVNDNVPHFGQDVYFCNVSESIKGSIPECSTSATDDDDSPSFNTLSYALTNVEPGVSGVFFVNNATGHIEIRNHLDYENNKGYILTLEVSDGTFHSQCRVILTVLDENDNKPEFRNLPPGNVISVLEVTPVGDVIFVLEAHDNDINDVLTYSVVPKGTFAVNKSSGIIQLLKDLNASSVNNYNLTVTVSDGLHDTSTILIIDVKDVNNNPPIFEKMNYNFTVAEGGIFKTHVKASDADINDNITYSLIQGPWQNNFTINTKTGNITSKTKLDREAVGSEDDVIILEVIATDSTHPYRTGLTTVSIKVTDVNDNLPYFTRKDVLIEIEEMTVNKTVLTLEASDDDIGKNNEILFKQSSSRVSGITITEDGKLQIDKPLQIHNQSSQTISIDVVAFNPTPYIGDHSKRNKTQTIQITIKDVNDHGPVFSKPTYNFVVAEGTVGTLSSECIKAMDNDVDVSNMMITYRLVSGNEDGHLYIDSHTGCLQIVRPYDYENSTKYSVVIGANDAKPWYKNDTKIHNVTTRVNIRIQDVNDNVPHFGQDVYFCNVSEYIKGSIPECSTSATDDDDSPSFNTLSYALTNVEPGVSGVFFVNNATGHIEIRNHLDYENNKGYILTLEVSDGTFHSQCRVILTVLDENDNKPEFRNLPPGNVISVLEVTPVGDVIFVLEAHDNDVNDELTYSIAPSDTFTVNKSSGIIRLIKTLNASSKNSYPLKASVSDGLHNTTAQLMIHVEDVNDNPPIFEKTDYNITVAEGKIFITQVKARDADINDNITYFITKGQWQNNFTINAETGNITSKTKLDREAVGSEDDVIILDVIATDSTHPYRTGLTTVSIKVTDVNDNLPYFNRKDVHIEIEELTVNKTLLELEAFDDDIRNNSKILFKQSSGRVKGITITEDGKLQIDKPIQIYNESSQTISMEVVAYNPTPYMGVHKDRNNTQTVHITINDVNNHGPVFPKTYNLGVYEGITGNVFKGCIKATDEDIDIANKIITYRIISGDEDGHLNIDSSTGCLQIVKAFDYEKSKKYSVKIEATDLKPWYNDNVSVHNVTTIMNITVRDVNDNAPHFDQDMYFCNVSESINGTIHNCPISAVDNDITSTFRLLKFTLNNTEPNAVGVFLINDTTGSIGINQPLDYEDIKQYILTIEVSDDKFISHSRVVLEVLNENDNQPAFTNLPPDGVISVLEDTPVEDFIYSLDAHDDDFDELTYFLIPKGPFDIDQSSGIIRLVNPLNASAVSNYNLTAIVSDGLHNTSTYLIIHVKDINDNPPIFEKTNYNFTVEEGTHFNKHVKASDADINDKISYSLIQGQWKKNFTISSENGTITSNTWLDRESLGSDDDIITLDVVAKDSTTPYRTGITTVSIKVMDINDNLPYFTSQMVHIQVEEMTVNKTGLLKLEAFDEDNGENGKIIFRQSDDKIDGIAVTQDGFIMIDKPIQIYNQSSQIINIDVVAFNPTSYVGDINSKNNTQTVQIELQDVNNHVPKFTKSVYHFTLNETTATGGVNNTSERIRAADDDIDEVNRLLRYGISGGNSDGTFDIDSNTGELLLLKKLDFESKPKYTLTVMVENIKSFYNGSKGVMSTATVVIDLVDSNDEPPIFQKDIYTCNVRETEITMTVPLCLVSATDKDVSEAFHQLTYHIVDTSPKNKAFGINSTSGELSVTGSLDYDKVNEYIVTVNVTDGVTSDTCTVIVHILNINNHPPSFMMPHFIFNLTENEPVPALVGLIEVVDQDGDNLTFCVNDSDFRVYQTSGELLSLRTFDYETQHDVTVSVNVTDGNFVSVTKVTVNIVNINDNDPRFTQTSYSASIPENATIANLTNVHATDADNLGQISYTLLPSSKDIDGLFKVDSKTGQLSVNNTGGSLDYDTVQSYTLFMEANDGSAPERMSYTAVKIDILDVNDEPPKFITPTYSGKISENAAVNSTVFQVFAVDVDTKSQDLHFKVENSSAFQFLKNKLENVVELDAETQNSYFLNISVYDGIEKDYAVAAITVTDVNDNDPTFVKPNFVANVSQLASPGQFVTNVSAWDRDISNKGFTYFLSSDVGYFVIDDSSGIVSVSENNNWRPNITYNMTVFVLDHGQPPRMSNSSLSIFIDASNHFDPVFSQSYYIGSVFENSAVGSTVNMTTDINATDADGGKAGDVRYYIMSGADDKFEIDNTTGILTVTGNVDCERKNEYQLDIIAKDLAKEPRSAQASVKISIENVNEAPTFSGVTQSVCLNPPIPANVAVVTVQATDNECTKAQKSLKYALQNGTSEFRIDTNAGVIYTKKNLSSVDYVLVINVTDEGGLIDERTLKLSAGNNGEPVIQPLVTTLWIKENQTASFPTKLTKINATSRTGGLISFAIANSSLTNHFVINNATGALSLTNSLDKEGNAKNDIELLISASNENGTCTSQVLIHVEDINDNPPVFTSLIPVNPVKIPEDTIIGTCVATLTAADADYGGTSSLNFSITSDTSRGKFRLSPLNGTKVCLNLTAELDYESDEHLYHLEVSVTDDTFTTYENLTIEITDINDNGPEFLNSTFFFSIKEESPKSTIIGKLEATDPDSVDKRKLIYAIIGDDKTDFNLRKNHGIGELLVHTELDREITEWYNFSVAVYDGAMRNDTAQIFIHVLDINDNTPRFSEENYFFNVIEGIDSVGETILLSASDADLGYNGKLFFNITNGNENKEFNITTLPNKTAIITCIKELDREKDNVQRKFSTYDLTISVTDEGSPRLSSTAYVEVRVNDTNDCEPEFDNKVLTATVMEGSPIGFSVLSVTANDCDYEEEYRNLSYSLSGDSSDMFSISKYVESGKQIGTVTLNKKISILEGLPEYVVNITVSDGPHSNYVTLFVNVTDVNDHDPEFNHTIYKFTTPENDWKGALPSTVLGSVKATDEDLGRNGDVSYQIISSDVLNLFSISKKDGKISVIGTLDRDSCISNRYSFTVIATDNGISQRTGYTEVVVYVTDVNDNYPEFQITQYRGSVDEDSLYGTPVTIIPPISATDIDNGKNGTEGIRYSLLEPDGIFTINQKTGEITVNASNFLDTEQQERIVVEVTASDRLGIGNLSLSKSVNLTIEITNKNDVAPSFLKPWYYFNVTEAAKVSELVGYVTAEDHDVSNDTVLEYSIVDGAKGRFYMDKTTGEIKVGGGLDRETEEQYNLTVRVTDGLLLNYTHVTIVIDDVNDNAPEFQESQITVKVPEGLNANTPQMILELKADDKDAGMNKEVTYSFNDTDLGGIFSVNGSGAVFLHKSLDRETNDSYTFHVYAEDHGSPKFVTMATVHIIVRDINDNAPIFYDENMNQLKERKVTILEKSPTGVPVYIPHVEDIDKGENATISYRFEGDASVLQYFAIDARTGMVTVQKTVDVNTLQHDHTGIVKGNSSTSSVSAELSFLVVASDGGNPSLSSNITLTILIEGINDDAPVFRQQYYNFSIPEEEPVGTIIGTVDAYVRNESIFILHYSIIDHSDAANYFDVSAASGNITTKQILDREVMDKINFAVEVRDGRTPERTAYTVVEVVILDINDNSPIFNSQSLDFFVAENQRLPSPIYVKATDADTGNNGNISYEIVNQTSDNFILDPWTGRFDLNHSLDREETAMYRIRVEATDHGQPNRTSSTELHVHILDINDNAPEINLDDPCTVEENLPPGQLICNVSAVDDDEGINGTVTFSLMTSDGTSSFFINPLSGSLYTTTSLDFETQDVYNMTVTVSDLGYPSLTSSQEVSIRVVDVFDTVPYFKNDTYLVSINSELSVGSAIINVTASGHNVSYSITSGNEGDYFTIQPDTGIIELRGQVKTASDNPFLLQVMVQETNYPTLNSTSQVIVYVVKPAITEVPISGSFNVSIEENHFGVKVIYDVNTTAELSGKNANYKIVQIVPSVNDTFQINSTSGIITCIRALDREIHSSYHLTIRYQEERHRRKREVQENFHEMILVVGVTDVNDNAPKFANDTLVFGIPIASNPGDVVFTVEAEDPDEGINGQLVYRMNPVTSDFYLDPNSGEMHAKSLIYHKKADMNRHYDMHVSATDENGFGNTTSVRVIAIIIPDDLVVLMTVNRTVTDIIRKKGYYEKGMSRILNVKVEFNKLLPYIQNDIANPQRADIRLHAISYETKLALQKEQLEKQITFHQQEIKDLFRSSELNIRSIPRHHDYTLDQSQIALITIAVTIFVGTVLSIFILQCSWKQSDEEEKEAELYKHANGNVDSFELESMHPSEHGDLGVINPVYQTTEADDKISEDETNLNTNTKITEATTRKRSQSFESQELTVNFLHDVLHEDDLVTQSNGDSGVEENESNSSRSGSIQSVNDERQSPYGNEDGVKDTADAATSQEIPDVDMQKKVPVTAGVTYVEIGMDTGDTDDDLSDDENTDNQLCENDKSQKSFPHKKSVSFSTEKIDIIGNNITPNSENNVRVSSIDNEAYVDENEADIEEEMVTSL